MMGVWERIMMGFVPSPYMVTIDLLEVECLIRGYQHDLQNIFQWHGVVLNLHVMKNYQLSRPWVYTFRLGTRLANYFFSTLTMVDQQPFRVMKAGVLCVLFGACSVSWEF